MTREWWRMAAPRIWSPITRQCGPWSCKKACQEPGSELRFGLAGDAGVDARLAGLHTTTAVSSPSAGPDNHARGACRCARPDGAGLHMRSGRDDLGTGR